ncbi:MltR family transcriptional regulator [Thalassospiraceae bacterium LMO-SO8]|nr:hypothetical protein [Alphaproteobacteria bacterium LMO-S08]WND75194.1 MltR family transcriptional regulator [Thalassospiraceae bacterium LMO-SO8]
MATKEHSQEDIAKILLDLGRNGHAAHAIWVASNIEENLSNLLFLCMPNLSKRLREKLFTGYGPLGSFSAKIDIAYALGAIPAWLQRDLHIVRDIRNEFAHSKEWMHFDHEEIKKLLAKFPDYKSGDDGLSFYLGKLSACTETLTPEMHRRALIRKLTESAPPAASSKKSASPSPRRKHPPRDDKRKGE